MRVVSIQPVRLRGLTRLDHSRLRALPMHPVHSAALDSIDRGGFREQGRALLARDGDDLCGYLMYHALDSSATHGSTMLDFLYSPYPRQGVATQLMDRFESAHQGATICLLPTVPAMGFYQQRGYRSNWDYMLSKKIGL